MGVIALARKFGSGERTEEKITRADLPYTLAMIVLDILAPIFLLLGLSFTTAANASLLNNFEIVATALIALVIFGEKISPRLWLGIGFVAASCALLSFEDISSLKFSLGSVFILLACLCWGIENNCTRRLSAKDPLEIVLLKGIFSGLGSSSANGSRTCGAFLRCWRWDAWHTDSAFSSMSTPSAFSARRGPALIMPSRPSSAFCSRF